MMQRMMHDLDGICGDVDECPYDAENDADEDGQCGDVDVCPYDAENDADGDGLCVLNDICPYDSENDADGDGICGDVDECPYDAENDADEDGICGDVDDCPYDAENDADQDDICGDVDDCPYDPENDADQDGVCGDIDICPGYDDNQDTDTDQIPDGCDATPDGDVILTWLSSSESHATLHYESNVDIHGFQFTVSGVDLTDAYDGVLEVQYNEDTQNVIAYSIFGNYLEAGSGILLTLEFSPDLESSTLLLSNLVVAGSAAGPSSLGVMGPSELVIVPCANNDGDDLCNAVDICLDDAENDADEDDICGDVDECPYDAENDADEDDICGDVDECPYDA